MQLKFLPQQFFVILCSPLVLQQQYRRERKQGRKCGTYMENLHLHLINFLPTHIKRKCETKMPSTATRKKHIVPHKRFQLKRVYNIDDGFDVFSKLFIITFLSTPITTIWQQTQRTSGKWQPV